MPEKVRARGLKGRGSEAQRSKGDTVRSGKSRETSCRKAGLVSEGSNNQGTVQRTSDLCTDLQGHAGGRPWGAGEETPDSHLIATPMTQPHDPPPRLLPSFTTRRSLLTCPP